MLSRQKLKRLSAYSLFAAGYLFRRNEAISQIVYKDMEPDIVLDMPEENALLDLDSNGTIDFAFLNSSFTFYSEIFGSYFNRQDLLVGPALTTNSLIGNSQHYGIGSYDFYRYLPYALQFNYQIDSLSPWQNNDIQLLALITKNIDKTNTSYCFNCNWYGFYQTEDVLDHYLGIRFIDTDSNKHYGWIRCDVIDTGRILIIKDYAYETVPDYPIEAGSKTSYANIGDKRHLEVTVYSSGNIIYAHLTQRPEKEYRVKIYNVAGQCIFNNQLSETFIELPMHQPIGIYFVEIKCGTQSFKQKLFLENG